MEYLSSFNCLQCDHKGSANPYPKFPEEEKLKTKLTSEQYQKEKKMKYVVVILEIILKSVH